MLYINGKLVECIESAEFKFETRPKGKLLYKDKIENTPEGSVKITKYVECSVCGATDLFPKGKICNWCGCRWT